MYFVNDALGGDVLADKKAESRKIRPKEGNAKCRYQKILTCKETLRQVVINLGPRTPYPPLHTYIHVQYYTYSHREGVEGELNQREG